jgi:hypothetical protein
MFKLIALAPLVIALTGCGYKHQPIYNVDDPIPPAARPLPVERIEALIVEGGGAHGWTFRHAESGHLIATQQTEKFWAVVDIYFDHLTWRIAYQNSSGLRAGDGTIHAHYNLWIRHLERDINSRLSVAPPGAK